MTIISSLVWRHISSKYSHHQANIESRFRYIKCAPNGDLAVMHCSSHQPVSNSSIDTWFHNRKRYTADAKCTKHKESHRLGCCLVNFILYIHCFSLRAARCNGFENLASVISGIEQQVLGFQH
jgi:hypothetical protein